MRVAVVDIGTNSTRLLISDVGPEGRLTDLERISQVTRLGQDVDETGNLAEEAMERVFAVLDRYRATIDAHGATATRAVLTSAVRDAANGADFTEVVRERYGLETRTIAAEEEARLTFLGATSDRAPDDGTPLVVMDIGGGSTELVIGAGTTVQSFVSLQAGVVRHSERHLRCDPPEPAELQALTAEIRATLAEAVTEEDRERVRTAIAVAGTATSCAAIELEVEPYDSERVQGHQLREGTCELLLARLATMTEEERRAVVGLQPDRAPTILAGVVMLLECMRAFDLDRVEVSEHDLLRGAALDAYRIETTDERPDTSSA
ncbi:MAG TPA: Ppx/GppA phosphatase family protein [Solirubrobacteraceae bacterium]|nr:Ppx/GppA phosphatase family protein [Solirubrobacteraceae bacterium]